MSERGAAYKAHLASAKWGRLRADVIERERGRCQGCGTGGATDVHHASYAHFGDEFLFELQLLCRRCHDRWHRPPLTEGGAEGWPDPEPYDEPPDTRTPEQRAADLKQGAAALTAALDALGKVPTP